MLLHNEKHLLILLNVIFLDGKHMLMVKKLRFIRLMD